MIPSSRSASSSLSLLVAQWVDADLDESLDETLRYRSSRVFAVRAATDGFTRELVDCDADPYALITRLPPTVDFDVACLVMTGWMTPLESNDEDDDAGDDVDDGRHRWRVRLTAAVSDEGVAVVVRRWDGGEWSDSFADGGEGAFPDALRAWWSTIEEFRKSREDRSRR